jgi:hypothetical protein
VAEAERYGGLCTSTPDFLSYVGVFTGLRDSVDKLDSRGTSCITILLAMTPLVELSELNLDNRTESTGEHNVDGGCDGSPRVLCSGLEPF